MEEFDFLILRQMLHRLHLRMLEPVLKQFGLTQMEEDILMFLASHSGHDTAAELVNLKGLAKSQVSTSVERLVQRGYLRREPEGRKIHLRLLPAAEDAVRLGQECEARFAETMLQGFSQEEQDFILGVLIRLTENARRGCREVEENRK